MEEHLEGEILKVGPHSGCEDEMRTSVLAYTVDRRQLAIYAIYF